jgi:BirA family biotin operon repressor/biotin-[acetyl-CoA-carboxylase] ligase
MSSDLDPEALAHRVSGTWGRSMTVLEATGSTMDDAAAASRDGAPDGHVIVADRQTEGRGAHGRKWESPAGTDLYFSIVARPQVDATTMPLVTLATGLGVRDTVSTWLPKRRVTVKWPNDIWVDGRKCAGILVESRMVGDRMDSVIIGIGLNVNRVQWPPELEDLATSLRAEREDGSPLDRAEVLIALLANVERWVTRFLRDGAPVLIDALRPHLALVGEPVRWEDGSGVFEGIDREGAAQVRTAAGLVSLRAARLERIPG